VQDGTDRNAHLREVQSRTARALLWGSGERFLVDSTSVSGITSRFGPNAAKPIEILRSRGFWIVHTRASPLEPEEGRIWCVASSHAHRALMAQVAGARYPVCKPRPMIRCTFTPVLRSPGNASSFRRNKRAWYQLERRTLDGCLREAARAGTRHDMNEVRIMTPVTIPYVVGSADPIPYSRLVVVRVTASATSSPASKPSATGRIPCTTTNRTTSCGCAPSASLTPISLLRSCVLKAMTP